MELLSFLSYRLKSQNPAIGYCKTLPAKAVPGRFALFQRREERIERGAGNTAGTRFRPEPAMQRPAKKASRFSRQRCELQPTPPAKWSQLIDPRIQRGIVFLQQLPRSRRPGKRVSLRCLRPRRQHGASDPVSKKTIARIA